MLNYTGFECGTWYMNTTRWYDMVLKTMVLIVFLVSTHVRWNEIGEGDVLK